MTYIKVKWLHDFDYEPVVLYSELDSNRFEVRKVEIFPDGTFGYADDKINTVSTQLGKVSVPPIDEIAQMSEFEPLPTNKEEFEKVWERAISSGIKA